MPFLIRGKARSRQNRQKSNTPSVPPPVENSNIIEQMSSENDELKITYQEVTYRVPKEERLLDLPLEEEVEEEYSGSYSDDGDAEKNSANELAIGVVLKKKRKK